MDYAMYQSLSDEALTSLVSTERNERALEVLIDRYARLVKHVVSKYIDTHEDVEEAVNAVWVKFWRRSEEMEVYSVKTFFCHLAKCEAISAYHCRRAYAQKISRYQRLAIDEPEVGIEAEMIQRERTEMRKAEVLSIFGVDEVAEVFRLRYFERMSVHHIADALRLDLSRVHLYLHWAKKALWDMLGVRESVLNKAIR